jgi:hypothetical protein
MEPKNNSSMLCPHDMTSRFSCLMEGEEIIFIVLVVQARRAVLWRLLKASREVRVKGSPSHASVQLPLDCCRP